MVKTASVCAGIKQEGNEYMLQGGVLPQGEELEHNVWQWGNVWEVCVTSAYFWQLSGNSVGSNNTQFMLITYEEHRIRLLLTEGYWTQDAFSSLVRCTILKKKQTNKTFEYLDDLFDDTYHDML